jgi:hypothetical protein
MTDRAKFEQMLEYLINEDQEKAKEIFHTIVVEKSREIYENLLAEDFDDIEEADDSEDEDEKVEEADDKEDEEVEEDFAFGEADDDMGDEGDDSDSMDASDDFMNDVDAEGDDEEMDDQEQTDRILDLETALDDLKAEFEKLMSGDDDMGDMDDMGDDDMGDMDDMGDDDMKMGEDELFMREYVEKVPAAKMGDNGVNTKSIVAKPNNMGGTSANIARGGVESESASTKGGLADPSTKEDNAGNVNTPGSKKATKWNNVAKGHGAEKKGAGEVGGTNTKSIIGR